MAASALALLVPLLLWDAAPAQAQSRFWFPTTEAPAVSPAFQTGWEDTAEGERRKLRNVKGTDTITVGQTVDIVQDSSDQDLDRQFTSTRMAAGVAFTSGITAVSSQLMVREINGNDDVNQCILGIRIVSDDGLTLRATLLAVANYGVTAEFTNATTMRNKTCADGDTITASYTTVAGDRIVVEIGYQTDGDGQYSTSGREVGRQRDRSSGGRDADDGRRGVDRVLQCDHVPGRTDADPDAERRPADRRRARRPRPPT